MSFGSWPSKRWRGFSWKIPFFMALWYVCSGLVLFANKYLLTYVGVDADLLGCVQILSTTLYGSIQLYVARLWSSSPGKQAAAASPTDTSEGVTLEAKKYDTFYRDMILIGAMRFGTIILSLVSLKSVAASFTQTIKASAPVFTVLLAWLLLGERSGLYVNLSLLPIMAGLVLVSYTEISFQMVGFIAAMLNNVVDCLQNVFSKKLISQQKAFTPVELQFYSNVAAVLIQLPLWLTIRGAALLQQRHMSSWVVLCLLFDGLMFHSQCFAAYHVVSVISPVTFSVSNTVKRASLTFLSVLVFGNRITDLTLTGTIMVLAGVFVYNAARNHETTQLAKASKHISSGTVEKV